MGGQSLEVVPKILKVKNWLFCLCPRSFPFGWTFLDKNHSIGLINRVG